MRRLTVGVPTRDRPDRLAALLDLLGPDPVPGWRTEVLVADGSAAPSPAPAGVTVLPVRGGVSTGRNALAAAATGDVLVYVDDDVRPDAGALAALVAAVRPGTAVAGAVAGLGHRGEPRSGAGVLTRTGFGAPVPPGAEPDYLVSALLALPRDVYTTVRWDERYAAAHLDDLAFGLRLRAAGVRMEVCAAATAAHPPRAAKRDPALAGHRAALVRARYPGEPLTWLRALAHTAWDSRDPRAALVYARGLPAGR